MVSVDGQTAAKVATAVAPDTAVVVHQRRNEPSYVSRGGLKLSGALDALGGSAPTIAGRRCLDAGASTGGFTDVLLRRGATEVVAVDVGYGQLDWSLRTDARVRLLERTNVRTLTRELVGEPLPALVVADLSFISLRLVMPALRESSSVEADFLLLVKPQFEVGRDDVGAGGVVRDPELRASAVLAVAEAAGAGGLGTAAVIASPLPGPAGNVEYFVHLRADAPAVKSDAVRRAVEVGPQ
jgi:23S rRNA (cytidine1920-2'-O)/16S rRNA (cytidine1409-2'-O)-methyltransferase